MVSAKGKGNASTSISSPKNDTAKTALAETTVSSPAKMNPEEVVVVSETEYEVEHKIEEVKNGENAIVVVMAEETVIAEENNGENAIEEEKENEENSIEEENKKEDAMEEEENTGEEQNKEKVEESSKKVVRKSRKRSRGKVAQGGSKAVVTKNEDKPESSGKKKASEKVESMGMIFMCSSKTKKDCYRYNIFGLPASKKDLVQKIYKGMRLFLYDFDKRLMYGIYKAAGPGGFEIEPKAFNSSFPSQVRFTVLEDCLPLPEEKFKNVIKDNYYSKNKFDCQLASKQVKELCKLFVATSKGPKSKKEGRSLGAEKHRFDDGGRVRGGRIKRRGLDKERPSALRRERRERPSALRRERRYNERPIRYEREVFASPVARVPAPSYAYEMDAYRLDPQLEHRGLRLVDVQPIRRDEIGTRDPYLSYRETEPRPYRDPVYAADLQPEYYPPAVLPPEYRLVGPPTEYLPPAGLRPEYRLAGPPVEYRSSAALPDEYPHRPLYRY